MATKEQKERLLEGIKKQNERYQFPTRKKEKSEDRRNEK